MSNNRFYTLPHHIKCLIYSFDDTYHNIFSQCIKFDVKLNRRKFAIMDRKDNSEQSYRDRMNFYGLDVGRISLLDTFYGYNNNTIDEVISSYEILSMYRKQFAAIILAEEKEKEIEDNNL